MQVFEGRRYIKQSVLITKEHSDCSCFSVVAELEFIILFSPLKSTLFICLFLFEFNTILKEISWPAEKKRNKASILTSYKKVSF